MLFLKEDVFIVFGSASDSVAFEPIQRALKEKKISCSVNVLSAHRTPKALESALSKSKARLFVAGAGLSAALPGVVASQTVKPVIGISCLGAFDGLDSFLATVQMPPGVPVLALNVGEASEVARHAKNYFSGFEKIVLVNSLNSDLGPVQKAKDVFNQLKVKFAENFELEFSNPKHLYVVFVSLDSINQLPLTDSSVIVVPVKSNTSVVDAQNFFMAAKKNLFVGVNRGENAALGAIQLFNLKGKLDKSLLSYRKEQAKKVLESNKLLQKK